MDLLSTLLVCSLYGPDPALVRAITANSHENPYFVMDPAVDTAQLDVPADPKTQAEALARAEDITSHGGKPLLGLLQLPPAWLTVFGRALPDAFDPCMNIAIGSAMLSAFDDECAHGQHRRAAAAPPSTASAPHALSPRRLCVLRTYGDALGETDFEELIILELSSPSPAPVLPDPSDAPIFPSLPPHAWGPDCLLVPLVPTDSPLPLTAALTQGPPP